MKLMWLSALQICSHEEVEFTHPPPPPPPPLIDRPAYTYHVPLTRFSFIKLYQPTEGFEYIGQVCGYGDWNHWHDRCDDKDPTHQYWYITVSLSKT